MGVFFSGGFSTGRVSLKQEVTVTPSITDMALFVPFRYI